MRVIRNIAILLLIAAVGAMALQRAYRIGQERFLYQVERLSAPVSIPVIYDTYSGSAEWVEPTRVRVDWTAISPEHTGDGSRVRCVAKFRVEKSTCYLLESGDMLYVERGEFIEPLILAQTYYARHGKLPPEVTKLLDDPDLDRNRVAEVLSEMNR